MTAARTPTVQDMMGVTRGIREMTEPNAGASTAQKNTLFAPLDHDFVVGALAAALAAAPVGSRFHSDVDRARLATMSADACEAAAILMFSDTVTQPGDSPREARRRERALSIRKEAAAIRAREFAKSPDFPRFSQEAQSKLMLALALI